MKFVVHWRVSVLGRWPPSGVPTDAGFRQVQARVRLCLVWRRLRPAMSGATAPGIEGTVRPAVAPSLSASPRSGDLHVTKECSEFNGTAGTFCTITSSNLEAIEVGSRSSMPP